MGDVEKAKYNIEFFINRLPFQLQHEALKWVTNHNLFDVLINNAEYQRSTPHKEENLVIATKNLNNEQNLAVQNIIASDDSIPFLLYGPPGMENSIIFNIKSRYSWIRSK